MAKKPSYEELEQKVLELESKVANSDKIEETVRETEEKYPFLIENIPCCIWVSSEHGKTTFISPNVEKIYGFSQKEIYRKGESVWFGRIHHDDIEFVRESFNKIFTTGQKFDVEYRIKRKDGKWIWLHDMAIMAFEKNNTRYAYGVFSDITRLKQAEEALRREKYFTDAALDSQMDTFFLFEPSTGKTIRWNKTFRDIVGYTDEEIASLPAPASYYSPDDIKRAFPFIEKVMTKGTGTIELELICKDGRRIPTEYRVAAIRDQDGKPEYLISIGRDITERKQAEETLRESEASYRLLFSAESDAIIVVDAQTKHIVNANEAALVLYGYERKEFLELSAIELSAEQEKTIAHIEKVASGKLAIVSPGPVERLHKKKDGTTFPVEISSGKYVHKKREMICAIIRDITKRKQAEEALEKKKVELSLKAKNLEEVNTTLRVLLKAREKDKSELEDKVLPNIKDLVLPYIERIRKTSLNNNQRSCIDILESNLEEIVSPFARKLSSRFIGLTPTEIRVANLVKEGKTTKEIAEFMHLSPKTVEFHRNNIREKLEIKKSKMNLRTYLLSM
jgi:PAS domain S-box-containing protein